MESAVLELMSEATQAYLKRLLAQLATVAWQRRGGLSEDLLRGLEARMEDLQLPRPAVELRKGLVPRFPSKEAGGGVSAAKTTAASMDTRQILRREEEIHRLACLSREAGWEAEIFEAMAAADAEWKAASKRRSLKNEPPQRVGVEFLSAFSKSGRLSMEQVAANEFVRRVGFARGVGLSPAAAAEWRRKRKSAALAAEVAGKGEGEGGVDGGGGEGGGGQQRQQKPDQMQVVEEDAGGKNVSGARGGEGRGDEDGDGVSPTQQGEKMTGGERGRRGDGDGDGNDEGGGNTRDNDDTPPTAAAAAAAAAGTNTDIRSVRRVLLLLLWLPLPVPVVVVVVMVPVMVPV
ncbi:unnamed protein product [Pylaiella littoralis]